LISQVIRIKINLEAFVWRIVSKDSFVISRNCYISLPIFSPVKIILYTFNYIIGIFWIRVIIAIITFFKMFLIFVQFIILGTFLCFRFIWNKSQRSNINIVPWIMLKFFLIPLIKICQVCKSLTITNCIIIKYPRSQNINCPVPKLIFSLNIVKSLEILWSHLAKPKRLRCPFLKQNGN
jgi:hypothetical protein